MLVPHLSRGVQTAHAEAVNPALRPPISELFSPHLEPVPPPSAIMTVLDNFISQIIRHRSECWWMVVGFVLLELCVTVFVVNL